MNEMDTRFANQYNIQWFPGHMTKTLRMMEQEIQHVDASLVLLDARIPLSSLNPEIERITARKPKLYALNKADLADPAVTEEWIRYFRAADAGCVAISAKQKGGANAVKTAIEKELAGLLERRQNRGMGGAKTQVMLCGIPNVGKSTFINTFAGLPDISIGNTICDPSKVQPLPFVKINDPTVEMTFSVNDSPFAGKEGKYVTSRQIRDRLMRELLKDVALKVEDSATNDSFRVMGRGEMHLSILIETMRREGYELQVSPPHVLTHEENGKVMEPMERVVIDVPEIYQGNVMTALGARKAILMNMQMMNSRSRIEFRMPSRGLFGYRSQFLTDTHGEGIMNTIFDGYEEWCGDIQTRSTGSLISFDTGDAVTYGLFNAQQRGTLIVNAGEKVYAGEVVGYTPTGEDITVNVCKTKHLTNTRASGSDDALRLVPVSKFSLEGCLEFLAPDELLEVTPENLRIRKRILDHDLRMKAASKKNK